jgi:hypothetical protein
MNNKSSFFYFYNTFTFNNFKTANTVFNILKNRFETFEKRSEGGIIFVKNIE